MGANETGIHSSGESPAAAGRPEVCVILNRGSGGREAEALAAELRRLLAGLPGGAELRTVGRGKEIGPAADLALREGFRTIVAAGGDGTVAAVAARLAGTGRTMGVLPLGTFNQFARRLGVPEDPAGAVRVLAEGRVGELGVGELNGRIFVNNASLGVYPAILRRREWFYKRWGRSRIAHYWSVISGLLRFRSPLRLRVTVDGQVRRRKTPLVFVANNPYQLDLFGLEGGDCIRRGQFALIVAPDCGRLELVWFAVRLVLGRIIPAREFELFCGNDILVEDRLRHRLVARDGERELVSSPFRFTRRPGALRILMPR